MLELQSDLWLDLPGARERIEERRTRGRVTDAQPALLRFVDEGYMNFPVALDCPAANKTSRTPSMRVHDRERPRRRLRTTGTVNERDRGRGLDSSLRT